jgi:hypothetical protein
LQFVFRRDRENDPAIHAVRDVVSDVWAHARVPAASGEEPSPDTARALPL